MALRALADRSLGDQVFDQLAAEILSERYASGAALPAERALAEIFRVNRHVVREALKRLEQVGLITTARSGRTEVSDFKGEAGLEVLAMMAEHARGGDETTRYMISVLEMRALIGADIVRLCALRASEEVRQGLLRTAKAMRTAASDDALFELEVEFWRLLLEGAGNVAYRLAFNSLLKGALAMGEVARQWSIAEIKNSDFRKPLSDAIAAGRAEEAEELTKRSMRAPVEALQATQAAPR